MSRVSKAARDRARLGQNFLVDRSVAARLVDLVAASAPIPLLELGAGRGAITRHLVATGRDVLAVEIDPALVAVLRRRFPQVRVVPADMSRFRFADHPCAVVGNLPFGITTERTRRVLATPGWPEAALIVQWQVARKRAIGGSLLNAQWAPWYEFQLHGKVPARAFRPVPAQPAGLLRVHRRADPLLPAREMPRYQRFVRAVYTAPGQGLATVVANATGRRIPVPPAAALPRDLSGVDWVRLYRAVVARPAGEPPDR